MPDWSMFRNEMPVNCLCGKRIRMMCKVCLLADARTERRNRGIYRNMLRLRTGYEISGLTPRGVSAMAICPCSELISVSLKVAAG
jgi:hypothetical protein